MQFVTRFGTPVTIIGVAEWHGNTPVWLLVDLRYEDGNKRREVHVTEIRGNGYLSYLAELSKKHAIEQS